MMASVPGAGDPGSGQVLSSIQEVGVLRVTDCLGLGLTPARRASVSLEHPCVLLKFIPTCKFSSPSAGSTGGFEVSPGPVRLF